MEWTRKHLLGLKDLTAEEITCILDQAESFVDFRTRRIKKSPLLRGKVVVNLFFESSTRTTNSFQLAAKRLSADTMSFTSTASSVQKGESLLDTARNIEAMGVDVFVVRHSAPGAPHFLAANLEASVINAGDGAHEHPTQGLLDIFTIRKHKKRLRGLQVAIVGDIRHSRVARSNAWGLTKLGAEVWFVGPPTLIPPRIEKRLGVQVSYDLDEVLPRMDVINCLRIQFERKAGKYFPGVGEYSAIFGINDARLKRGKEDVLIMHPGPINRGIELTPEVADGERSVILDQVANGLAVRMAVLSLVVSAQRQGAAASAPGLRPAPLARTGGLPKGGKP